MAEIRFPDAAGKTLFLRAYGEQPYYCPVSFPRDVVENIHNVHIRDDDVILCSYPKTGCHWVWEMARLLRMGTADVELLEKEEYMMELAPQDRLLNLPPQRVLNTHAFFRQLPQKVKDGRVKIVFLYRNPKDVAVSYYHHHRKLTGYQYHGEFVDYLPALFLPGKVDFGSFVDYIRDWERVLDSRPDLSVFVVSYEELQADTFGKTKELAEFLESPADEGIIRDVLDKCSFPSMREWSHRLGKFIQRQMYRKGVVGDWKNWFTVAHSEMMDRVMEENMTGSRFCFQYTL